MQVRFITPSHEDRREAIYLDEKDREQWLEPR